MRGFLTIFLAATQQAQGSPMAAAALLRRFRRLAWRAAALLSIAVVLLACLDAVAAAKNPPK